MAEDRYLKKALSVLLITVMTLATAAFAWDEALAEDEPEGSEPAVVIEEIPEADPENPSTDPEKPSSDPADPASDPEVQEITLNASGEDGSITVVWKPFTSEEYPEVYYMAFLDDSSEGTRIEAGKYRHVFTNVSTDSVHSVTIKACATVSVTPDPPENGSGEDPSPATREVLLAEGSMTDVSAKARAKLGGGSRGGANLGINLKTLAGEKYDGYSVVQGGGSDGTYAYYLMVSSATQDGRILKMRIADNAVVAVSGVIDIEHGNGMTVDAKRKRLVIVGRYDWSNKLTLVDTETLSSVSYVNIDYSKPGVWSRTSGNGVSAIAYVPSQDCYLALQRKSHDILVLDPDFRVTAFIGTVIKAKYPGTYQAIDADDRYLYILLSAYDSRQKNNLILALDWNRENLGINDSWMCNNDLSGTPDAAIVLNTPHEAENIYHIDQGDGTARFYLSEYHNNPKTRWETKTTKYKVKWKKVRKKVKVKWKKVKKRYKVNGKWKKKKVWKYRYKWKKVWKYKTKYKTEKVKKSYLNKDDYVYDLGIF